LKGKEKKKEEREGKEGGKREGNERGKKEERPMNFAILKILSIPIGEEGGKKREGENGDKKREESRGIASPRENQKYLPPPKPRVFLTV